MGLRYTIPFKDIQENSYLVEVYREDYTGSATELTGATSCFVVSGTDEDFVYTPIRTSTATINVLDSDLLLDLYSINNQYAPVKLYKNGVLEWTGYIKPEQFTQPYVPNPQSVSVECVSAVATLEHIEYVPESSTGTISIWELLKKLIGKCNAGYRGVYIPFVYGNSSAMSTNVLEEITLIENNFKQEEMNCYEVMEAVCKFLNWTVLEIGGCLYFVDSDWTGTYRLYDEALSSYTNTSGNAVTVQDIGYNGSDGNVLDVVPGYNKASVKALNHVFDEPVKDEPYDILEPIVHDYLTKTYSGSDGAHAVRKKFLKPMFWTLYQYRDAVSGSISKDEVYKMSLSQLDALWGALMMKEADYKCVSTSDTTPAEGVTEFNYVDSIQIRVNSTSNTQLNTMGLCPAIVMEGEYAVYSDCAISLDCTVDGFFDDDMVKPGDKFYNRSLNVSVECNGKFYNGSSWVNESTTFDIELDETGHIKSNKTPYTPYDLNGYVIPFEFFAGKPKITIYCPVWMTNDATHYITGTKIRNLKFGYAKKEGVNDEGENGDRVYENVVNEAYMSKAEEIEFDISSYNNDGATYSKALINGAWLTNNLYCTIVNSSIRPEELMIRRIVNRYRVTKIKLSEALQMTGTISPLTRINERTQAGKTFRMTSGEWDYEQHRLTIQMQEDA